MVGTWVLHVFLTRIKLEWSDHKNVLTLFTPGCSADHIRSKSQWQVYCKRGLCPLKHTGRRITLLLHLPVWAIQCWWLKYRNIYHTICLKTSSLIPHIPARETWSRNADWIHSPSSSRCPEWILNVWWNSHRANVSRTVMRNTKRCQTVEMCSQNCSCG